MHTRWTPKSVPGYYPSSSRTKLRDDTGRTFKMIKIFPEYNNKKWPGVSKTPVRTRFTWWGRTRLKQKKKSNKWNKRVKLQLRRGVEKSVETNGWVKDSHCVIFSENLMDTNVPLKTEFYDQSLGTGGRSLNFERGRCKLKRCLV